MVDRSGSNACHTQSGATPSGAAADLEYCAARSALLHYSLPYRSPDRHALAGTTGATLYLRIRVRY
jgi:hypothetical protein